MIPGPFGHYVCSLVFWAYFIAVIWKSSRAVCWRFALMVFVLKTVIVFVIVILIERQPKMRRQVATPTQQLQATN